MKTYRMTLSEEEGELVIDAVRHIKTELDYFSNTATSWPHSVTGDVLTLPILAGTLSFFGATCEEPERIAECAALVGRINGVMMALKARDVRERRETDGTETDDTDSNA